LRGERLGRQWQIIQLLLQRRKGMSAAELAAELGWSVRNIYRDLEALQQAGFPMFTARDGRKVRWAFVEGFRHATSIPFTADELMALEVGRGMMRPVGGTVFADALDIALSKIRAQLPEQICDYLDRCRGSFTSVGGPIHDYGRMTAVFEVLREAVEKEITVEMNYLAFSTGTNIRRRVDPYGLFHHAGTIYLVGRCHLREELRNFAVDRVRMPALTGDRFEKPAGFDLDDHMRSAFGAFLGPVERVVLRFGKESARYVRESVWHASQFLEELDDGGCRLGLEVPVSGEIERWVLSWGGSCEVEEPVKLRLRVARSLEAARAHYAGEAAGEPTAGATGEKTSTGSKKAARRIRKKSGSAGRIKKPEGGSGSKDGRWKKGGSGKKGRK